MPQNQDLYMITRKQCRLSMFCFFGLQVLQQLINIIEILRNFVICNVPGLQLISQPSCYGIILCGQFRYPFPAKLGFLIKDWMTEKITNSFLLRLHVICLAPGDYTVSKHQHGSTGHKGSYWYTQFRSLHDLKVCSKKRKILRAMMTLVSVLH